MTKSENDSAPGAMLQANIDRIAEMELAWLKPMGAFGVAMADAWADLIAESAAFMAARLRQDARAQHAILHCRSPKELQEIQSAFFQKAIDDYREETGRISALVEDATKAAVGKTSEAA